MLTVSMFAIIQINKNYLYINCQLRKLNQLTEKNKNIFIFSI
jgi:hypothetical protein